MKPVKRLFKYLCLFILPIVLSVAVLFLVPLDKQFAYHQLRNECNKKAPWIHDRIFINPTPVDVAFIGSSRTKASYMEDVIEDSLRSHRNNVHVVNLGYCRWGRNMDYAIIKDLFRHKKVKYLILELHEEEERLGHIDFAYIADSKDVLDPVLVFNQHLLTDVYHACMVRFSAIKHSLFYNQERFPVNSAAHGYLSSMQMAGADELANARNSAQTKRYVSSDLEDRINNRFPVQYLNKIASLAQQNGCKLFFVYLPGYGALPKPADAFDYCKPLGTVLIPPAAIFDEPSNWKDNAHFNDNGSAKLSAWLADQLTHYMALLP